MKSKTRRAQAGQVQAAQVQAEPIQSELDRAEPIRAEPAQAGETQLTGNDHVRIEMQTFLQALRSYPERFARNPRITFAEHCSGLVQTAKAEPRRRD